MKYYNLLRAWHVRTDNDFRFVNSHEKTAAIRDSSKRETLRRVLVERLGDSKNVVLILGETTRFDQDWVPFEIAHAIDVRGLPIIAAYPGYDCIQDPAALGGYWPAALSNALDLAYVRSVLWFLLLGLTLRYSQLTLNLERQYGYIHQLEEALQEVVHPAFRREGRAYLENYPRFLTWAHFLYTVVFPLLLCVVALCWTYRQFPTWPWPWTVWFNLAVTVLLLVSVGLYLQTLHRERISRGIAWWRAWWSARAKPPQAEKSDGATQPE
jgi:hypothetical protein